ncbi:3d996d15-65c1-4aa9-9e83-3c199e82c516 [Thermothielavioides terrestris]|uniref:DUF1772-domain-containing protein n=2 Tax=Thermothielavioides terrestris TaxID=2587410 RepID=G2REG3_THETT|nr:uncharacterized protein THITE_2121135 [Thermothielavioides terrestris NRRL 8126]AEO70135.1 hypothetical protein THITE_2121135 [Thermothielavioides terrestris NRRL 8126]SPQ17933.1 3d996d15-65c1-4aa9-9e83-3c199e82c516 [Thermothielavioides terrestris]
MTTLTPAPTTAVRLTQGAALFLSSFTTGISLSLSAVVVPCLLDDAPRDVMLAQWARVYALGARTMPFAAAATAAAYLWLGLRGVAGSPLGFRSRCYLAAGALTLSIVPYTFAAMRGLNARLLEMRRRATVTAGTPAEVSAEEQVKEEEEMSAKAAVDWWGVLNLGRTALLAGGAICGLVAVL